MTQRVSERQTSDAENQTKTKARCLIHVKLQPSVQMHEQDQDAPGLVVVKGHAGELISKSTTKLVTCLGAVLPQVPEPCSPPENDHKEFLGPPIRTPRNVTLAVCISLASFLLLFNDKASNNQYLIRKIVCVSKQHSGKAL